MSEEQLQKFHINDDVSLGTEILVELLIGRALREISFNQSEALTAQTWLVTRHRHWISVVVSQTSFRVWTSGGVADVGCFLRLLESQSKR